MALGYDWLYPVLSSSTRQRVIDSLNLWVDWYDASGFIKNDPIGNYFVGYLLAKTLTGLATEGDNPKAVGYFADVQDRLWGTLALPAFQRSMVGGGWPEGWGYGPRAVLSVAEFLWAVKTAKGLDWEKQVARCTTRPPTCATSPGRRSRAWMTTAPCVPARRFSRAPHSRPRSRRSYSASATRRGRAPSRFGTDVAATRRRRALQLGEVLVRRPGTAHDRVHERAALVLRERARPRRDALVLGKECGVGRARQRTVHQRSRIPASRGFNAGSLSVVVGGAPLLVNATGWIPKLAGTAGEDFVYEDSWGSGKRRLYNTFFVDDSTNPYNPGQNSASPSDSSTHLERYDEGGVYLRARAAKRRGHVWRPGGVQPIAQFTRDVVYLRPGTFVLYDRTTATRAGVDQWLAFHTPRHPCVRAPRTRPRCGST